jgi:hypothetical protein
MRHVAGDVRWRVPPQGTPDGVLDGATLLRAALAAPLIALSPARALHNRAFRASWTQDHWGYWLPSCMPHQAVACTSRCARVIRAPRLSPGHCVTDRRTCDNGLELWCRGSALLTPPLRQRRRWQMAVAGLAVTVAAA